MINGSAEYIPEWLQSHVQRSTTDWDARFPWVLMVTGVPSNCGRIMFEQFVSGGFTIHHSDGSSHMYLAPNLMRRINQRARQLGRWTDDLLPEMRPGPRSVNSYSYAQCSGGVTRPANQPLATMRGPSADPRGAMYRFEDAPGFNKNFGDTINEKIFIGITWDTSFQHKLWREGDTAPFYIIELTLTGQYTQAGTDTRRILIK